MESRNQFFAQNRPNGPKGPVAGSNIIFLGFFGSIGNYRTANKPLHNMYFLYTIMSKVFLIDSRDNKRLIINRF